MNALSCLLAATLLTTPPDVPEPAPTADDWPAVQEALQKLAEQDQSAAEVVRLRFFAGLPLPEVARLLDISPRTADRL